MVACSTADDNGRKPLANPARHPPVMVLSTDQPCRYTYGSLCRGVNTAEQSGMGVARFYPTSYPAAVAESYVLL
jgi:hypothetical protein